MPSEDFYLRRADTKTLLSHIFQRLAPSSPGASSTFYDPYAGVIESKTHVPKETMRRAYNASEHNALSSVTVNELAGYVLDRGLHPRA
jgi:hypothetical protein